VNTGTCETLHGTCPRRHMQACKYCLYLDLAATACSSAPDALRAAPSCAWMAASASYEYAASCAAAAGMSRPRTYATCRTVASMCAATPSASYTCPNRWHRRRFGKVLPWRQAVTAGGLCKSAALLTAIACHLVPRPRESSGKCVESETRMRASKNQAPAAMRHQLGCNRGTHAAADA
jgi:hypothetical protein